MQPRWRCCFPAAVVLLLLRASSAAPLVYARFLSSRRLQTKERWHRQLPLLHQQHPTSFFDFVPSSALCPGRPTGRRHMLPRKPQCAETPAAAAAKPATRRTSVCPGAGISAAGGRNARRLQKAARQTAAAAAEEETATRTCAAAHFAAAFAAHLPSSAAAAQKTAPAYLTAPLHAALSAPAAPCCRRATRLRICRTAARGLLSRCVAPHAALQAADTAAVGTAGATPVTAAAGTAPRAAAAGGGGGDAGGGTAATARKDVAVSGGSSVVSCATHLISETQRAAPAQVACEPAANETETTAEEEGQLQLQQDVLGKNFRPAAADASVKPQDIASTCGVPVGSVAGLQEYARRLGFSLRRDGDVEVVSSSSLHAIEDSMQQQQLELQQREERDQRKPLPQHRRGGKPEVAEERRREKPLQREQEQQQQPADPVEWTREEQHQQQRCREQQQGPRKRRVVVLGSTGSIGRSTLQVVEAFPERFEVVGLAAAGTDLPLLLHQIRRHGPRYVAVGNAATAAELRKLLLSSAAFPQAAAAITSSLSAGASPAAGAAASTFLATAAVASAHAATATATFAPAAGSAAGGAGAAGARSTPTPAAQSPSLAAATSPGTAAALPPAACNATNVLPAGAAASRAAPTSPLLDARAPATVPLPGVAAGCSVPEIVYGDEGLVELAALDGYDVLVSAIVGFAGLQPTLKALTTGKDVALANKEALVAAGSVFRSLYETCNQRLHGRDGRSQGRSRQVSARSATPLGSSSDFAGTRAAASAASDAAAGSTRFPPCAAPFPSPTSFSSFISPSLYPSPLCAQPQQQRRLGMLLPVDSEHSAIFQALQGVAPTNYPPRRLLLVATGGPFRGWKKADLQQVTLGQVLKHPRWSMGAKISVDSATLMNKGLEVIEAHYAFGCPYTGIDVLVHPQAIVHSAVELCDGAVLAQLGTPDMKLPIAYALTWPERLNATWPRLDLLREGVLTFEKPDLDTFGCLRMAYEAGMRGGLAPACLNAANEIAVSRLLDKKLSFLQIEELVRHVLREYDNLEGTQPASDAVTLQDVLEADAWARRIAREWKK